jgi:hypothetical protein
LKFIKIHQVVWEFFHIDLWPFWYRVSLYYVYYSIFLHLTIVFEIVFDHFVNQSGLILVFVWLSWLLIDQEELIERKNQLNKDKIFF